MNQARNLCDQELDTGNSFDGMDLNGSLHQAKNAVGPDFILFGVINILPSTGNSQIGKSLDTTLNYVTVPSTQFLLLYS